MCLEGASGAGAELLKAIPDEALRAYLVWVPMLPPDNEQAAEAAALRFAEPRATHYWDGDRDLARRMARALGIEPKHSLGAQLAEGVAWDVFLAYGRGAKRVDEPDFWMHQMWGLTNAPLLDTSEWRRQIEITLDS